MPEFLNSSYGLKMTVPQVVAEVVRFMEASQRHTYKVTIGTDSELLSGGKADFVTAIVVHRVGNGGRFFWRRVELENFHTLRDRIIREVLISLEIATQVLEELKGRTSIKFDFEIHADIGENGPTKAMLQEVVGMIRAYNFEVRTKPESYAATSVADRLV
jgi:predicted RNase H-related nuclease YkuK (DUF458 family)